MPFHARGAVVRVILDPREASMCAASHRVADASDANRSTNLSRSGENAQDNDLIVIRDARVVTFEAHFERMRAVAPPKIEFAPAIRAIEPR
jgi:hypothetical protein